MRIAGVGAGCSVLLLGVLSLLVLVPTLAGGLESFPRLRLGLDFEGGTQLVYELEELPAGVDRDAALAQAAEVIRERVAALGLDGHVASGGAIAVELTGDPDGLAAARSVVGRSSVLELRFVDDRYPLLDHVPAPPPGIEVDREVVSAGEAYPSVAVPYLVASGAGARERLGAHVATLALPDREVRIGATDSFGHEVAAPEPRFRTYVVEPAAPVTGAMVADARVELDPMMGRPTVLLELDFRGAAAFEAMTRAAVKRRIAIVLDGEVMSAPVVQEPIGGGRAQITLGHAEDPAALEREARELAIVLRSGALPSPLRLTHESMVGSTYGPSALPTMVLGSLFVALALLGVAAVRYRAATIALASPFVVALAGLATAALLETTVTLTLLLGVYVVLAAAFVAAVPLAERLRTARRAGEGARSRLAVVVAIPPAALATVAVLGAVLYAVTSGPARGFAAGLLVASAAGVVAAGLWSLAAGALLWPAKRRLGSPGSD